MATDIYLVTCQNMVCDLIRCVSKRYFYFYLHGYLNFIIVHSSTEISREIQATRIVGTEKFFLFPF